MKTQAQHLMMENNNTKTVSGSPNNYQCTIKMKMEVSGTSEEEGANRSNRPTCALQRSSSLLRGQSEVGGFIFFNDDEDSDDYDGVDKNWTYPGLTTQNNNFSSWYDVQDTDEGTEETEGTDDTNGNENSNSNDESWFDLPEAVDCDDENDMVSIASSSLSTTEHYMQLEKRRSIRFHPTMVTEIRTRPRTLNEDKPNLFFSVHELQKTRDEESNMVLSRTVLCSSLTMEEESDSDDEEDSDNDGIY